MKGLASEHLGRPIYRYLQNPDDKTRWLIDKKAVEVVHKIFFLYVDERNLRHC